MQCSTTRSSLVLLQGRCTKLSRSVLLWTATWWRCGGLTSWCRQRAAHARAGCQRNLVRAPRAGARSTTHTCYSACNPGRLQPLRTCMWRPRLQWHDHGRAGCPRGSPAHCHEVSRGWARGACADRPTVAVYLTKGGWLRQCLWQKRSKKGEA